MKTSSMALVVIVIAVVAIGAYGAYLYMNSQSQSQFKVAAIFTTPLEEPWNNIMYQALLQAKNELGTNFTYIENVATSDVGGVTLNYINLGYTLIIPDSWGFWQSTDQLSKQYPKVYFGEGSGLSTNFTSNLLLFDSYLQESAYVAGFVGASISNTSKLGVVAAFESAGDVADLINGFIAGARSVNPNVNITVAYINSWYDPASVKSQAQAMIASGIDVIYSEREGAFEACVGPQGQQLALAFGNYVNQNDQAPNVCVGSVVWNNYPMLKVMIQGAQSGNFPSGVYYATMKNNDTYFLWNPVFQARYPAVYSAAQTLVQNIVAGNVYWNMQVQLLNGTVVNGSTVKMSVPNFIVPSP